MTASRRRIRAQLSQLGVARVVAAGVSALWLIVAARNMSLTAYGDFTQVVSLSVVLGAAADLGLSMLLAHDVARWPQASGQLLRRVCRHRLVLGLPAVVLMAGLYWVAAADPQVDVALLAAVSMLATMVHQSVSVASRSLGDVRPEAANELLSRALVAGAGYLVLAAGGSVLGAVAVYAAADAMSAIVLWVCVGRRMPSPRSSPHLGYRFSRVAVLGFAVALTTLYSRADIWLIGVLETSKDVARYAAPYRVFEGVLIVAATFAALTAPVVARPNWDETMRGVRSLVFGAAAITTAIALVGFVAADQIMGALYGSRFAGSSETLRILMVACIPSAVALVLMQAAGLLDRWRSLFVVALVLVLNVVGNCIAIPMAGGRGAAAVTLVTQTCMATGLGLVVFKARLGARSPEASLKSEDEYLDEVRVPASIARA